MNTDLGPTGDLEYGCSRFDILELAEVTLNNNLPKANPIPPNPASIVPLDALPPLSQLGPDSRGLARSLAAALCTQFLWVPFVAYRFVLALLRLVTPYDELAGLAGGALLRLGRQFAIVANRQDLEPVIDKIADLLQSAPITARWPAVTAPPRRSNFVLSFYDKILVIGGVDPLLTMIHKGLVRLGAAASWSQSDAALHTIAATLTALTRTLPVLDLPQFDAALCRNDLSAAARLLKEALRRLRRRRRQRRGQGRQDPIKQITLDAYLRDFVVVIGREDLMMNARALGLISAQSQAVRSQRQNDGSPEGDRNHPAHRHFDQLERRTRRELTPGEMLHANPASSATRLALSSDRRLMVDYVSTGTLDVIAAPHVALGLAYTLWRPPANDVHRQMARLVVPSWVALGRPLAFLRSIRVGPWPTDGQLVDGPIYVLDRAVIVTPAESQAQGVPEEATRTPELFYPTARFSIIPLPAWLEPSWHALGLARQGQTLFDVTEAPVHDMLAWLTGKVRATIPHAVAFTEGRLRNSAKALALLVGRLDPLLWALVSGQWGAECGVPAYYTTLTMRSLARRFRQASDLVYSYLLSLHPGVSAPARRSLPPIPALWIGSPYRPRWAVMRRVVRSLRAAVAAAATPAERHNALTLLVISLLGALMGLRMQEVECLLRRLFDLDAVWNDVPLPWLVLDAAKASWFTTAARIVPIPAPLLPWLREVLDTDPEGPAFTFIVDGRPVPATADAIHDRLARLGIPLPHYHAGRHLVRSALSELGMPFDEINFVIGHQSQGHEMLNPFRPGDPERAWRHYLRLAQMIARALGLI